MAEDFNLNFFNAAMKQLQIGSKAEEFATNYANASNESKGSSLWQKYYNEGLKQFATIDIHSGSEGEIDNDEFKIVGLYIERLNNPDLAERPSTQMGEVSNSALESIQIKGKPVIQSARDDVPELHNLKPIESMTIEEVQQELEEYRALGLVIAPADTDPEPKDLEDKQKKAKDPAQIQGNVIALQDKPKKTPKSENAPPKELSEDAILRKDLETARLLRSKIDAGSDKIDYHIGTFNQGGFGTCAMLSQLNGLSDDVLHRMIKEKIDENGKKYYEVTFPIDSDKNISVKVTEEELSSRSMVVSNGDVSQEISGFSEGDLDVSLIEMAFLKRFGINTSLNGVDIKFANDIFTYPEENNPHVGTDYEITEDKIQNAIARHEHATVTIKHTSHLPGDFSYNRPIECSNGSTASWVFTGSDRDQALENLENMLKKYSSEDSVDMSAYEQMSDAELMDATHRFVSADYGFYGSIQLSNGCTIMENHAYTLKGYDPATKELILANPYKSNEDIRVGIEIAEQLLEISV